MNFKIFEQPDMKSLSMLLMAIAGLAFYSQIRSPAHLQTEATDSTASLRQVEKQAFELVNKHRIDKGLPVLVDNGLMDEQARNHSKEMASGQVEFGHSGADERFKIISKSIKGMEGGGENVFTCTGNYPYLAQTAVDGWLASKGHRENIEGDYNISGMGVARAKNGNYYFTQIFVKEKE